MQLTARRQADLHRSAYAAGLRSALADWGRNRDFAAAAGITREYLQYLLQPENVRSPSPDTAVRIARLLRLSPNQERDLVEHMSLSAERRVSVWQHARDALAQTPGDLPLALARTHWERATYGGNAEAANADYLCLEAMLESLLWARAPKLNSLDHVEACLILHDVLCTLDRPVRSLYYAKLAQTLIHDLDSAACARYPDRFEHLKVNAYYAAVVSYTNLRLPRSATQEITQARDEARHSPAWATWLPHFERSSLANLGRQGRFGIYEADAAHFRAQEAAAHIAGPYRGQFSLLIDKEYALTLTRNGQRRSARRAYTSLRPVLGDLESQATLGPLRRTVVLAAMASVCQAVGELDEAMHYARIAHHVASDANLRHQLRLLVQSFPGLIRPADS